MTDFGPPILMTWTGNSLVPVGDRWAQSASKQLTAGERYLVKEANQRSGRSHNHYFACINHAWQNLPESMAHLPHCNSAEHLRKFALIACGFRNVEHHLCSSKEEAERWALRIRPLDEFAIVHVDGNSVVRMTAESQSKKDMGPDRFQDSKQKVMEYLADQIGVSVVDLANIASNSETPGANPPSPGAAETGETLHHSASVSASDSAGQATAALVDVPADKGGGGVSGYSPPSPIENKEPGE